jgi:hypothetical protein
MRGSGSNSCHARQWQQELSWAHWVERDDGLAAVGFVEPVDDLRVRAEQAAWQPAAARRDCIVSGFEWCEPLPAAREEEEA